MNRCSIVCLIVGVLPALLPATGCAQALPAGSPFSQDTVIAAARQLAQQPFSGPDVPLPPQLAALDYDHYRRIQYLPTKIVPSADAPFRLAPFHRGFIHRDQVRLNIFRDGRSHAWRFDPSQFQYDGVVDPKTLPDDVGFAGMKILCRFNRADRWDELISFLGASYFRALGRGQTYGTSARGLAVNCGIGMTEEFPYLREFWIEDTTGRPDAKSITFYALLDSQSVTGAYQFIVTPGKDTVVEVHATLFARRTIERLGIAPLTSMYHHGEDRYDAADYRPEVHDADGLLIARADGRWVWRTLRNPKENQESFFKMDTPRGFGLMQRDRDFDHYQDMEANYQQRSSIWIEPVGKWGPGTLELMELHAPYETYDSVVAQWTPDKPVKAGDELTFAYRMRFMLDEPADHPGGSCVATRVMRTVPGQKASNHLRYLLDFAGPELAKLTDDDPPTVEVLVNNRKPANLVMQRLPAINGWRVSFDMPADHEGKVIEMLAKLVRDHHDVSETWSDRWP